MANKEMVEKKTRKGEFTVKIGSTDRNYQRVIFFEGTAYISPEYDTEEYFEKDMKEIEFSVKQSVLETINKTGVFQKDFISNFDVSVTRMKKGKYSCLQFEYYLIQPKSDNILTVKEIIDNKIDKDFLYPFECLENNLKNHDFVVINKKPKPTV